MIRTRLIDYHIEHWDGETTDVRRLPATVLIDAIRSGGWRATAKQEHVHWYTFTRGSSVLFAEACPELVGLVAGCGVQR